MRVLSLLAFLVGCGVSDSTLLVDMEAEDWEKVCEDLATDPVTATCDLAGTEIPVTVGGTEAECMTDNSGTSSVTDCEATVADLKECNAALLADPCLLFSETPPEACVTLFECIPDET